MTSSESAVVWSLKRLPMVINVSIMEWLYTCDIAHLSSTSRNHKKLIYDMMANHITMVHSKRLRSSPLALSESKRDGHDHAHDHGGEVAFIGRVRHLHHLHIHAVTTAYTFMHEWVNNINPSSSTTAAAAARPKPPPAANRAEVLMVWMKRLTAILNTCHTTLQVLKIDDNHWPWQQIHDNIRTIVTTCATAASAAVSPSSATPVNETMPDVTIAMMAALLSCGGLTQLRLPHVRMYDAVMRQLASVFITRCPLLVHWQVPLQPTILKEVLIPGNDTTAVSDPTSAPPPVAPSASVAPPLTRALSLPASMALQWTYVSLDVVDLTGDTTSKDSISDIFKCYSVSAGGALKKLELGPVAAGHSLFSAPKQWWTNQIWSHIGHSLQSLKLWGLYYKNTPKDQKSVSFNDTDVWHLPVLTQLYLNDVIGPLPILQCPLLETFQCDSWTVQPHHRGFDGHFTRTLQHCVALNDITIQNDDMDGEPFVWHSAPYPVLPSLRQLTFHQNTMSDESRGHFLAMLAPSSLATCYPSFIKLMSYIPDVPFSFMYDILRASTSVVSRIPVREFFLYRPFQRKGDQQPAPSSVVPTSGASKAVVRLSSSLVTLQFPYIEDAANMSLLDDIDCPVLRYLNIADPVNIEAPLSMLPFISRMTTITELTIPWCSIQPTAAAGGDVKVSSLPYLQWLYMSGAMGDTSVDDLFALITSSHRLAHMDLEGVTVTRASQLAARLSSLAKSSSSSSLRSWSCVETIVLKCCRDSRSDEMITQAHDIIMVLYGASQVGGFTFIACDHIMTPLKHKWQSMISPSSASSSISSTHEQQRMKSMMCDLSLITSSNTCECQHDDDEEATKKDNDDHGDSGDDDDYDDNNDDDDYDDDGYDNEGDDDGYDDDQDDLPY